MLIAHILSQSATIHLPKDAAWRGRLTLLIVVGALLYPCLVATQFKPWQLFDAQSSQSTMQFIAHFLPPKFTAEFLIELLKSAWITVAIATCGMCFALFTSVPLTLFVSSRFSISRLGRAKMATLPFCVRQLLRWLLVGLRSIPELVFALLLVRIFGLGPTAGVVAIALSYSGMLAKVYAEIIESSDEHASHTLMKNGSSRLQAFLYGTLPQCSHELLSYTIYRWECAIRSASIMGMIGAGGLGQQLDAALKMLEGGEVATILIVFMLLVGLADAASSAFRKWLN